MLELSRSFKRKASKRYSKYKRLAKYFPGRHDSLLIRFFDALRGNSRLNFFFFNFFPFEKLFTF